MKKFLLFILPWILVLITSFLYFFNKKLQTFPELSKPDVIEVNHHMVIDKIESMGKLELVKFYIKDIVEHTEKISWWPFDPKAVLIVSGEVVGCIDLTRLDSADVMIGDEVINVALPQPEICFNKVNHKESKVYDVSNMSIRADAEIIDRAYKLAESRLEQAAIEMNILQQTKLNAKVILKPVLESFAGKRIMISFKEE